MTRPSIAHRRTRIEPFFWKHVVRIMDQPSARAMPPRRTSEPASFGDPDFAPVPPGLFAASSAPRRLPLLSRLFSESKRRLFWTLADQGVVSVGNFLTGNQLARHLSPEHYGAFGAMLETLLFFNSLQAAAVIYPMTMKRARDTGHPRQIATMALLFTFALLPLLGMGMGAATYLSAQSMGHSIFGSSGEMRLLVFATVAAMLFWQGQELMRRAMMADLRFAAALPGDTISYLGQFIWIYALAHTGGTAGGGSNLTLPSALIAIGGTSAVALIVQAAQVGLARVRLSDCVAAARDFWRLGRWNVGASLTAVITSLGYIWTLKEFCGNAQVAAFAALCLLLKLGNPLMTSASSLIIPAVARATTVSPRPARAIALKYGGAIGALAAPYCVAIIALPTLALRLLYGPTSPYLQYGGLLRIAVINYSMLFGITVVSAALNGLGRTRDSFVAQCGYVLATLVIGLPMTVRFGVAGVTWGSFWAILSALLIGTCALLYATSSRARPA